MIEKNDTVMAQDLSISGFEPNNAIPIDDAVTAEAAIKLAGLDWALEKRDIFLSSPKEVDGIKVIGNKIPDKQAVVRVSDNSPLGIVGSRYQIIENRVAFDFMDSLVGEGQAIYKSAGSLYGGRKIFIIANIPGDLNIGGVDVVQKNIILTTSHDGSSSVTAAITPVRFACLNALSSALKGAQNKVKIRHSLHFEDKIKGARTLLGLANTYYQYIGELMNKLIETPFSDSDMKNFVEELIPANEDSSRSLSMATTKHNEIIRLFRNGAGHENIKDTRWAAYNAVTEYVDHNKPSRAKSFSDSKQFDDKIYGGGASLKSKAFEMLVA